jgi:hypothetical protein
MFSELISMMGRAIREPAVHTTAALASIPAADAGLKALKISTELEPAALARGLFEPTLWITLGICAVFGGVGGFMAELISLHGHIELPHRVKHRRTIRGSRLANPRYEIDLGVIARLLLGATAALALLSLYAPTSPTALVVNALIAGSAATGVFRLVQGRVLAQGSGVWGSGLGVRTQTTDTSGQKRQLSVVRGAESSVAH